MTISYTIFYALLLCYYCFAITLMITFFRWDYLKKKISSEYKAILIYFFLFFIFIFFIPFILSIAILESPFLFLNAVGFRFPLYFFQILAAAVPLTIISIIVSKNSPEILAFYPLTKEIAKSNERFVQYSICYLFFYYMPWEFLFRGVLLLGFLNIFGDNLIFMLIAFSMQIIMSTLMHLGHPRTEIWGSVFGGILFGFGAYISKSIVIPFLLHGLIGISTDYFFVLKTKKKNHKIQ